MSARILKLIPQGTAIPPHWTSLSCAPWPPRSDETRQLKRWLDQTISIGICPTPNIPSGLYQPVISWFIGIPARRRIGWQSGSKKRPPSGRSAAVGKSYALPGNSSHAPGAAKASQRALPPSFRAACLSEKLTPRSSLSAPSWTLQIDTMTDQEFPATDHIRLN
jgi:hypothetical protein